MKHALLLLVATISSLALAEPGTPTPQPKAAAEQFGAQLERAFNGRNRFAAYSLFDMHALAIRAADYQGMTGRAREQFIRDMEIAAPGQFVSSFFTALGTRKGPVKFMRATSQFPPRSLVRFDLGDQGVMYYEFIVATNPEGLTRAVDWWQHTSGELVSMTMGGLAQMSPGGKPGMLDRLFGIEPDDSVGNQLYKVSEYQRLGKYSEALEILQQIPEPTANVRAVLSMRASMAVFANRMDEYDVALEKLAQHHSHDPAASAMLLDYYSKYRNWPKVLAILNTMEKRVGKDGVTRLLRASAYLEAGDIPNALKFAEESIELESERMDSRDLRATLLVRSGHYPEAVAAYKDIEARFGRKFTREDFDDPTNAQFVRSAAFRHWLPR
jgi:tetratricopeptide (TPR) repeat protein